MNPLKKTTLSILLAGIAFAAFRLSFDAQTTLAGASGIDHQLAWLYPAVVDAAILAGVLIRIWRPDLNRALAGYLWAAIALWTATSIAGNSFHLLALPPGRIEVPYALAVAVNTVPPVTLFLVIHLTSTTAFAPKATTITKRPGRSPQATSSIEKPSQRRTDIPPTDARELVAMSDAGMSMSEIAKQVDRSKSYVGKTIKAERDRLVA
ncbi:MAG: DUF2637 domain-containing protein [Rhodoglobus sp.]